MEEVLQGPGPENETLDVTLEEPIVPQRPVIYEQADLKLGCSCGHVTTIETNVPKGAMRYEVYTVQGSTLPLMCESCGNKLTLYFDEAENPTVTDEQPTVEPVQEIDAETTETSGEVESGSEIQEEEIMTPYIYSVIVDESITNENGKYDMVLNGQALETENPTLLFSSDVQLTRPIAYAMVEGTPNLVKVGGDFKEVENESVPEERQA